MIKVLYIAGFERSGSTLVNRIFGQINDFVAWGELRDLWQHGIIENRLCTCGNNFQDCLVWQSVLQRGFSNLKIVDAKRQLNYLKSTRRFVALEQISPFPLKTPDGVQKYLYNLSKLYEAIQAETNCRVIVDSSKASWYGAALKQIANLDVYILHITRDPRGVCHSLQRRKEAGEPECQWYHPMHASSSWSLKNSAVESFLKQPDSKYIRIKFEDFVQFPKQSVLAVLRMLGEENSNLSFMDSETIKMQPDHLFAGSPSSRSEVGHIQLKLDQHWIENMSAWDKSLVSATTFPLRQKYGYVSID